MTTELADHAFVRQGGPSVECKVCPLPIEAHPDGQQALADIYSESDVHGWFGLSYAQYLTIPRSVMEAMPGPWQRRFVELMRELNETFDWLPEGGQYWVELRDSEGHFKYDPLREYRHPNRIHIESIRRGKPVEA